MAAKSPCLECDIHLQGRSKSKAGCPCRAAQDYAAGIHENHLVQRSGYNAEAKVTAGDFGGVSTAAQPNSSAERTRPQEMVPPAGTRENRKDRTMEEYDLLNILDKMHLTPREKEMIRDLVESACKAHDIEPDELAKRERGLVPLNRLKGELIDGLAKLKKSQTFGGGPLLKNKDIAAIANTQEKSVARRLSGGQKKTPDPDPPKDLRKYEAAEKIAAKTQSAESLTDSPSNGDGLVLVNFNLFEGGDQLLQQIEKSAANHFRTVDAEILYLAKCRCEQLMADNVILRKCD